MQTYNFTFLLFSIVILLCSCREKSELYKQVMDIHDEAMPKISALHKLKKRVSKSEINDSIKMVLIRQLDEADEEMMSWMANFEPPKDDVQKEAYLKNELTTVTKMSNNINQAIQSTKKHLDKH